MKINHNGTLLEEEYRQSLNRNRAFGFGDGLYDTLKFVGGEVEFLEEHYFRLMSSMRMLRMKIPPAFTLEVYQEEIVKTLKANEMVDSDARVRVNFYRCDGGGFTPVSNVSDYLIEVGELSAPGTDSVEVELFKDYHLASGLLSTIKTNNRIVNVLGGIFALENDFQNVVLMNEKKELVGLTDANLFLLKEGKVLTPALECGCINGIMRKKIIEAIQASPEIEVEETSITPFELLRADEVFFSNSLIGMQSVNRYRKKVYGAEMTDRIRAKLSGMGISQDKGQEIR